MVDLNGESRRASQDLSGFDSAGLQRPTSIESGVSGGSENEELLHGSQTGLAQTAWASVQTAGKKRGSSPYRRKNTLDTDTDSITVAATQQSQGSSQFTSTTVSNLWNSLIRKESIWDTLQPQEDDDVPEEFAEKSASGLTICAMSAWYEFRHNAKCFFSHPVIVFASLAVFALVCGVGMWAITGQKDAVVQERQNTAAFVATETAGYFASEFKKAFLPLYSLREAVHHSGYFDHLATEIGRYPNRLLKVNATIPGGLANVRNVTGICDNPELLAKWDNLVDTVNKEQDLNGMVFRYRMAPKNVFCLDSKGGNAMVDNGVDTSNSEHPFWSMVATDLFIKRWEGLHVFGPFISPKGETFCTHLSIWTNKDNRGDWVDAEGGLSMTNMLDDHINVHGTEVQNAWGFVMNYLDWAEMKKRSKMEERFSNVAMDFELNRQEHDVDPEMPGPRGEASEHYQLLAKSSNSGLLNDDNSILVYTDSLHGTWVNRVGMVDGWEPDWWPAAVACVVIASLLLGFLTASTLVKSQMHRELVERMVPKSAIRKLERNQTVVDKFNIVSVFFADIVGYSGAAGSINPAQVMAVLNDLYTELDKIATRHGVYKVETVGNRYMVCAGAPVPETGRDAAKRVSLFALDAMSYIDNKFLTKEGDKILIRAGVASGPAVGGVVGKACPRWVLFGSTVDIASAMEKSSSKSRIQCDEVTSRLLGDSDMTFVLDRRADGVDIKGRGKASSYWIEKAACSMECFELKKGSVVLDPCGHILSEAMAKVHNLNVCPICRSKVEGRVTWTRDFPASKYADGADSDMEAGNTEGERTLTDVSG
mmetsp:Transcript_11154/g.25332  ORF Transcript_11154/g.25332 Transcript_11154/m.25332 type:complete len:820 (+) Transcript_11154:127-2586(+)